MAGGVGKGSRNVVTQLNRNLYFTNGLIIKNKK